MKFEKKERLLATLNADVFDSDPYNAIFNSFVDFFAHQKEFWTNMKKTILFHFDKTTRIKK